MKYRAGSSAGIADEEERLNYILSEFQSIQDALELICTKGVKFDELHAEPAKLEEGLVVLADGTDWNPGSGAGLYRYQGGAWTKIG